MPPSRPAAPSCRTGTARGVVLAAGPVLFRDRLHPLPLFVSIGLLLLILGPYLIHDATHGWRDLRPFAELGAIDAKA